MTRKLRKRPDGLSYKEVFSLNDEKQREANKSGQPHGAPRVDASDTKPVVLRSVRSEQTDPVVMAQGKEAPEAAINATDLHVEDAANEKDTQEPGIAAEPSAELSNLEKGVRKPSEPVNDQSPKKPQNQSDAKSSSSSKKARLKGYIPIPALGVSPAFDAVHDAYGAKFAIKHYLDSAVDGFVEAVRAGKGPTKSLQPDYPTMPGKTQATRHIPLDVVDRLRKTIDPMGILSPGAFGTRVLEMAMVWHMKNDGKKD